MNCFRATDRNPLHSVALSFSVSTLYLLVQPRPKEVVPPSKVVQRGSKPIRRSYDDNYSVLMFAYVGWDVYPYMPSNSHIRKDDTGFIFQQKRTYHTLNRVISKDQIRREDQTLFP